MNWGQQRILQVGVRETRHIQGTYILDKEDILEGRSFDDQIGRGAYPLDVHDVKANAEVMGRKVEGGNVTLMRIDRSYGIPARCLIPRGVAPAELPGDDVQATLRAQGAVLERD